ncbi:MAG: DnaJ domain-containing protein [Rickettsiales bacterium]|nr:DnaJ domain-containing protein [Rickettsiales bacterium]
MFIILAGLLIIILTSFFIYKKKIKIPKVILIIILLIPLTIIFIKFGQFFLALATIALPIVFKLTRLLLGNLGLLNYLAKYIKNKGKAKNTNMKEEEAYKILGLKKGCSISEIKEKYKKMIKYNHPDKGGSEYISSLINEAKNRLVDK